MKFFRSGLGIALAVSISLLASPSYAIKEYYSLKRSIRALGMGGAAYGLSNDESALFYNPASLALFNNSSQFMIGIDGQINKGGISNINDVRHGLDSHQGADFLAALAPVKNNPIYASAGILAAFVKKGLAVGLLVGEAKANAAYMGKEIDSTFELTAMSDSGLLIAKSFPFLAKNLTAGITGKGLFRAGGRKELSVLDFATDQKVGSDGFGVGFGLDADVGFTYEFVNPPLGKMMGASLVFSNLFATRFSVIPIRGAPPALDRYASLGTYLVVPGGKVFEYFTFQVELAELSLFGQSDPDLGSRSGSLGKHINLGVETPFHGWLFARAGLHQGNWTAGLGMNLPGVKLEFATYGEELESAPGRLTSRRFALQLSLGVGATPKAPYQKG